MSDDACRERSLLLILPSKKEIYPLSTIALTRAQTSRRKLKDDYRDALLMERDGTVREIQKIDVLGPWGQSAVRKLFSRLTDGWSISVTLSEPVQGHFEEVKRLVADIASLGTNTGFPALEEKSSRQDVVKRLQAASTADALFEALSMPPPEEALDVL